MRLEIVETEREYQAALREIEKSGQWVSFDAETSGLNPFSQNAYIASLGIGTINKDFTFPLNHHEADLHEQFKSQTRKFKLIHEVVKDKKKIGHNGKFDSLFIHEVFGKLWYCDFDTMLAHYNINENERHGLKELSIKYFDADDYDIPLKWKQGIEGDLETHCKYLGLDLYYTRRLFRVFSRMLKEEKTAHTLFHNFTMPLSKLYTRIELRGVPIDESKLEDGRTYWEEISKSSKKELQKLTRDFIPPANKAGKVPELNFGSPTQLSHLLFKHYKLPVLDKTPKGVASTSESVLKRLDHPICKHILDNREANKNLSTFIDSWRSRLIDGRIHPSYKIHGTVTGRPSCEDPNLQQVPQDSRIRSIISAPKRWVLAEVDHSQAELRLVADASGDDRLIEIYNTEGGDVHTMTVQEIFGIMNPTKEERTKGKAVNFGFIYGMWWKKFIDYARDQYGQKFTDKEAENIRKKFFQVYRLEEWHKRQKALARTSGYVMSKIGRKRRLPDATRQDTGNYDPKRSSAERQAVNSPIQSLASDINLLGALEIDETLDHKYCQIVGTVHDSILILIREDKIDYCLPKIKKIMENPKSLTKIFKCNLNVPLLAEAKIGPWSKGVEYEF